LHLAAFDLNHQLLRLAALVIEEVDVAVDTSVGTLFSLISRTCVDKSERPPLKLIPILQGERPRTCKVLWVTNNLIRG
jgi:hypothetical protein